jgi:hypothetical protein
LGPIAKAHILDPPANAEEYGLHQQVRG